MTELPRKKLRKVPEKQEEWYRKGMDLSKDKYPPCKKCTNTTMNGKCSRCGYGYTEEELKKINGL